MTEYTVESDVIYDQIGARKPGDRMMKSNLGSDHSNKNLRTDKSTVSLKSKANGEKSAKSL